MGHSLCSFILRQIPRRSPTHNAVYFTTTRLGGYINNSEKEILIDRFFQVNRYSIRSYSSAYLDMGVLRKSYIPRTGR